MLRLLRFLAPYRVRLLAAVGSLLGSGAFVLLTPQLIRWAINIGVDTRQHDRRLLVVVALLIVASALLRGFFAFWQQYLGEWIAQRVAYDLRNEIYERLQRLSFAYHDRAQVGEIMSRVTQDVESIRMYVSMGLLRLAYVLVLVFVALVLMALSNLRLALVAWGFLPVIGTVGIVAASRLRPVWLRIQQEQGRLGTVLQENLSGMRVVKAFARHDLELRKFEREARALFDDSYRSTRVMALLSPAMTGLGALAIVATVWLGAHDIAAGRLTAGDLSAFLIYLAILQMPVRTLGFMVNISARAHSSGRRIYEILDAECAVREKPGAIELREVRGHVRFENVSFGYDLLSPVLKGIEVDAPPGSVVALLGPSGSGKSTVVNLLPRFYDPTGGRITVDGVDLRDVTLRSLRETVGIVHQDVFLFMDTIRENIRYGKPDASNEEVEAAARTARIHDFIAGLPDGYDTWVGERGVTLSGGQKQRVSIARTLLRDPRILILDDSTSSVDMETEHLIQQALAELMRGRTTFVIALRLRTVRRADQILVLDRGRIVQRGTHGELLPHPGLYRQIYELELGDQSERRGAALPETAAGG